MDDLDREPPPDDASELEHVLFRQDDVIGRWQALGFLTEKELVHRLRSGRWRRVHRSVYLSNSGQITWAQRQWVAVLATHGVLAGNSALEVLGLKGYRRAPIHVLVPAPRRVVRPPDGVAVHRTRRLLALDARRTGFPPCTMPARSLIDAAQWAANDDDACAIVAAGFQQRLVNIDDVREAFGRMRNVRRERLIREAAEDASGGAESISEIEFARLCRRAGLPEPTRQAVRRDATGRKRYRDVFFEEYGVQAEIDGAQHMEVRAWAADMRQHNEIAISGTVLLRFPGWLVRRRPGEVVDQLRAALVARGWRP